MMIDEDVEASYAAWMDAISDCNGCVDDLGDSVPIPILQESQIIDICDKAIEILKYQPMVVYLQGPICVVGDIHGALHDLIRIFYKIGSPTQANYLFLGDYVDRGEFSLEVITLLLTLFVANPDNITLLRGNHETIDVNSSYGFKTEICNVYGTSTIFQKFNEVFQYLPLSAIINNEIACFHGGISPDLHDMDQIQRLEKPLLDTSSVLVKNILWSDPKNSSTFYTVSVRSDAMDFGALAQLDFIRDTGMKLIIRAHECVEQGCRRIGKCITIFSSSDYRNGNQAAVLIIDEKNEVKAIYLEPLQKKHKRKDASYFNLKSSKNKKLTPNSSYPLTLKSVPNILCLTTYNNRYSIKHPTKLFSCKQNGIPKPKNRRSSIVTRGRLSLT